MGRVVTITLVALAYCASVSAEIYRWKDDDGHVVYSDTPQPGAEKVQLSEPTIVPSQPIANSAAQKTQVDKPAAKPYESVTITSPPDQETIRENVANISVSVNVQPALQVRYGHQLQLLFDGQQVGKPGRSLKFNLPNVDRGAHTLQGVVLDAKGGALARSPTSTFFVHKTSIKPSPR